MPLRVILPSNGPLAGAEPLAAAVDAAAHLGYAGVWSRSPLGLAVAASRSIHIDLGLLLADPAPDDPMSAGAQAAALLGSRLGALVVEAKHLERMRLIAPSAQLFLAGGVPPAAGSGDGWSPSGAEVDTTGWHGPLLVRLGTHHPGPVPAEVLVDLEPIQTLDELLAGWADVAEAVLGGEAQHAAGSLRSRQPRGQPVC